MAATPPTNGKQTGVQWVHWGPDAMARAQEADKPVLLSISAVWCYWCHVMEETTYTESDLVRFLNDNFVPVMVDNDHRPDVNARYNVGGWPTTAFLTPHGGYIAGATYLPADQLLAMLMEVKRAYDEDKSGIYDQAAQLHRQRQDYVGRVSAGIGELDHRLVDTIARRMAGAYDAHNGGFGEEPKFPSAAILQFMLHLYRTTGEDFYRAMVEKSLDGMVAGELHDRVDGGFFRYCAQQDWTEVQHEKMLEDNINLARVYLDASILLDNPGYKQVASSTLDYLVNVLFQPECGGFRGSQGAHSDYFRHPAEVRAATAAPVPDPFCYTGLTCQAVSLLLEAAWKLPRPELAAVALKSLEALAVYVAEARLPHAFDRHGRPSPQLSEETDLLTDWAAYLNALMDAHIYCPNEPNYLAMAQKAVVQLDDRFYDQARGGYFDIEADSGAVGYMRLREKPLAENVVVAEALMKLHHATGDTVYQLRAENVLRAYVEANRDFGEHAASYAVAVDRFLHPPVEITIEGEAGQEATVALSLAACKVSHPHVIVKPVPVDNGAAALAHVCVDTLCFPPVTQPEELVASVKEALEGPQTPAESIFERFVSF